MAPANASEITPKIAPPSIESAMTTAGFASVGSTRPATLFVSSAKATVAAELETTPEFTRAIVAMLSQRFQHLLGALEDCTLRSGVERVTSYLLNRLPINPVNGHAVVTLPAKKGVIASQLNLTHEHFSRLLHEIEAAGLIQVNGRDILIPDIGKLRAYPA